MGYGQYGSSLRDLPRLRTVRRRREASWDRTGGNDDFVLRPGQTVVMADIPGAGVVTHIWMTVELERRVEGWRDGPSRLDRDFLRRLVLRVYWDGQDCPSVYTPLGDFFGVGHARTVNFTSAPLQMSPQDGKGFTCWFPMPFAQGARFEITSECEQENVWIYWHIDYELFDELEEGLGRFHAQWRRERPKGLSQGSMSNEDYLFGGKNLDGKDNYTILETEGRGHYVGCVFNIVNLRRTSQWNWYGEGADMIFVDGEPFPPALHGTGTEDYFNMAWGPSQAYSAPYHGLTLPGGENWSGEISMYRFHVEDPITFNRSIRVSIEHGHDNRRHDDLSSVAYWYQELPTHPFELAPLAERLPFPE
jgi:hypothetical protein